MFDLLPDALLLAIVLLQVIPNGVFFGDEGEVQLVQLRQKLQVLESRLQLELPPQLRPHRHQQVQRSHGLLSMVAIAWPFLEPQVPILVTVVRRLLLDLVDVGLHILSHAQLVLLIG